jgi:hypothetical protein
VHVKHHRERVTFVRSMFCRHLKLRYDNLVRTQLQGHPHLAIELRGSVVSSVVHPNPNPDPHPHPNGSVVIPNPNPNQDAASDMLRQAELNTKTVHGAQLSEAIDTTRPPPFPSHHPPTTRH